MITSNDTTIQAPSPATLTMAELFERFLAMQIETRTGYGKVIRSFCPGDILEDFGWGAISQVMEQVATEIRDSEQPEVELEQIIEDLRTYAEALETVLDAFRAVESDCRIEPDGDEPADPAELKVWQEAWEDAEKNPTYRIPERGEAA